MKKTIVFVTHDIDEAIRLGDRIAIFATGGRLAQCAAPAELLRAPADDFVADFLGADRELKQLALLSAGEASAMSAPPVVDAGADAARRRDAAAAAGTDWVVVHDPAGGLPGWQRLKDDQTTAFETGLRPDDSLRRAMSVLLRSPIGVVPRLDDEGRFDGLLDHDAIRRALG